MSFHGDFSLLSARAHEFINSPEPGGDDAFNELALQLFGFQFNYNSPYRRICQLRNISPGQLEDWSRIPSMPTSAFKELDLSCLPQSERTVVFHSSGTTEHRPSRHFHNTESLALYETSLLRWFQHSAEAAAVGVPGIPARQLVILTPPPKQAPHSSLVHMFDTIRRSWGVSESAFVAHARGDGAWELSLQRTLDKLSSIAKRGQPVTLFGTAFSFVHLLDSLEEQSLKLSLPPGSAALETGGYKGRSRVVPKPELHRLMCSRLGLAPGRIICEYGMSELSSQAYQRVGKEAQPGQTFWFPPWARVQLISPENGQEVGEGNMGLIRVFDLANIASVAAVQTEDIGVRRGTGFELVGREQTAERRGCSLMPAAH